MSGTLLIFVSISVVLLSFALMIVGVKGVKAHRLGVRLMAKKEVEATTQENKDYYLSMLIRERNRLRFYGFLQFLSVCGFFFAAWLNS